MTNNDVLGYLHDYHLEILKSNVDWGRLVLDAIDEIKRLQHEVAYLKTPCPRCGFEDDDA